MDPLTITVSAIDLIGSINRTLQTVKKVYHGNETITQLMSEVSDVLAVLENVESHLRSSASGRNGGSSALPHTPFLLEVQDVLQQTTISLHDTIKALNKVQATRNPEDAQATAALVCDSRLEKADETTATLAEEAISSKGRKTAFNNYILHNRAIRQVRTQLSISKTVLKDLTRVRQELQKQREKIQFLFTAASIVSSDGTRRAVEHLRQMLQPSGMDSINGLAATSNPYWQILCSVERRVDGIAEFITKQSEMRYAAVEDVTELPTVADDEKLHSDRSQEVEKSEDNSTLVNSTDDESDSGWSNWEDAEDGSTANKEAASSPEFMGTATWTETTVSIGKRRQTSAASGKGDYCSWGCNCICHKPSSLSTATVAQPLFGEFALEVIFPHRFQGDCNQHSCRRRSPMMAYATYFFPSWLLLAAVHARITVPTIYAMNLELKAARIVPDSSLLFHYATNGNLEALKALFDSGQASAYDVDASNGSSALVYAVDRGHIAVWRFLVERGADKFLESKSKHSPMDVACTKTFALARPQIKGETAQHISLAYLAALREDFDVDDYLERIPFPSLHKIILGVINADLRSALELSTADINARDYQGRTALSWAAIRADVVSLRLLLDYGADPNIRAFNGDVALHYAVRADTPDCVQPLLDFGAEVDPLNAWQCAPLCHTCTHRDDVSYAIPLLKAGANVHLLDKHGCTALWRAVNLNRPNLVRCLLEYGATGVLENVWGTAPLLIAIEKAYTHIVMILLEFGEASLNKLHISRALEVAKATGNFIVSQKLEDLLFRLMD